MKPGPNASGVVLITVQVVDVELLISESFELDVRAVNEAPELSVIRELSLEQDSSVQIVVHVTDVDSDINSLRLRLESDYESLIPLETRVVVGQATVAIRASDRVTEKAVSIDVFFDPINDPPTPSTIPNQVAEEGITIELEFRIDKQETSSNELIVTATSLGTKLVSGDGLQLSGEGIVRTLTGKPRAGE